MQDAAPPSIRAIIGLGNPGPKYYHTRHSIGFRILDELAQRYGGMWHERDEMSSVDIIINGKPVLLVKPQTFMNSSGRVVPALLKKGIKSENILVVHDELELPFGTLKFKLGGSHRGHNGLRSIIGICGKDFMRLRFGIGRPAEGREPVDHYVLSQFKEPPQEVEELVVRAADMLEKVLENPSISQKC